MKLYRLQRILSNLRRNSRSKSLKLLQQRGGSVNDFSIRRAVETDIPQLAAVHVKAWADTYFTYRNPPTYEIRLSQWKESFRNNDGSWFAYVVVDKNNNVIGFAKGKTYSTADLPDYQGELNKIFLLFDYHRLGLGTRLLVKVAEYFITMGINNMVLFSEPSNPTGWFYEARGAKKLYGKNGGFHGGYAWDNLRDLVKMVKVV
ncbi:MAG: GNAT family N-acetyltransferase [Chitinophagaceae bacterium]|nr:GNAT family N-acetyltransferase [Chitinophagaceae bacterium]